MFKLLHKNRKGFSLVEVMVTVTILGLVMGIAGTIIYMMTNSYNASSYRWEIQSAVQLACTKFETNSDLITNSKQLDIFYDETVAGGIVYNKETGTFTWKNGGNPYVMPAEGTADGDYSYIFSTEAEDTEGNYLGYFMFIKDYDSTTSELFLDNEGFGEVPVKIELSIATDELELNTNDPSYQNNGVKMLFKSGNEEILEFEVETAYVLENINATKQIGMEGGKLILEDSWVVNNTAKAYPCGWSDETINNGNKEMHGYPAMATTYGADNKVYNFSNAQLQKTGNVLRFLSPLSDMSVEDGEGQGTTSHKGSCITAYSFSDGTEMSERVLSNLRNFRDEVLRGTEFGDWFIDVYYNKLSPFLIEHTAFLKPVYRVILTPISFVCDFIADL